MSPRVGVTLSGIRDGIEALVELALALLALGIPQGLLQLRHGGLGGIVRQGVADHRDPLRAGRSVVRREGRRGQAAGQESERESPHHFTVRVPVMPFASSPRASHL